VGMPQYLTKRFHSFLTLCYYQKLNPFIKEAYLIKYSSKYPASLVTGIETLRKRAMDNPKYRGCRKWTTEKAEWDAGDKRAFCEVHVKGYAIPIKVEVDYEEFVGLKQDGEPNQMWASKPKTMLKKVAEAHAFREAFPKEFKGMYVEGEITDMDAYDPEYPEATITAPTITAEPEKKKAPKVKQDEKVVLLDKIKQIYQNDPLKYDDEHFRTVIFQEIKQDNPDLDPHSITGLNIILKWVEDLVADKNDKPQDDPETDETEDEKLPGETPKQKAEAKLAALKDELAMTDEEIDAHYVDNSWSSENVKDINSVIKLIESEMEDMPGEEQAELLGNVKNEEG